MLSDSLRFTVDRLGPLSILHVMGTVDVANGCDLEAAIAEAARAHTRPLIVAFVECVDEDGTSLEVLTRQFKALEERLLVVVPPHSSLRRTIGPLHVVPPVHDGFREAILAVCRANEVKPATNEVELPSQAASADTVATTAGYAIAK